jgi:hypothetical protein
MKKIILFLFAALLTGNVLAYDYGYRKLDNVPEVGHYTWYHNFDPENNTLTFYDKFSLGVGANRKYVVHVYERKLQSGIVAAYRLDDPSKCWFHYGVLMPNGISENEIGTAVFINEYDLWEIDDEGHTGGEVSINLNSVITKAKEQNYTELHIAIEELTRPHWDYVSEWYPVETESRSDRGRGLFHNNYIDVDLPVVQQCELNVSSHNVYYGENFQVTAKYKASHGATLTIQYREKDGNFWYDLSKRTITAAEAKDGYQFTYKRAFVSNGMDAEREYRLKVFDPVRQNYTYSDMETVAFYYSYEGPDGRSYVKRSTLIQLPAPAGGKKYYITSDIPVTLTQSDSGYQFYMPACNVRLQLVDNLYTVKFYDYDYTLLKTMQVAQGTIATPPTVPSHAGMTFTGWDGDYTNIQQDMSLHALYSVEGVEVKLAERDGLTFVKEGEKVNLNIYVKTPSATVTKAYIQTALLEEEGQALNWSEGTTEIIFTAAEAQAGATKTMENTSVFAKYDPGRARYIRVRARMNGSSNDVYSNAIRIETYYPITINTGEYEDLWAMTESQAIIGNGTIYARPGDSIWFVDTNDDMCAMSVNLVQGWSEATGSETTDEGVVWSYIVMPTGYGANAIDVRHKKHTVLFYAEGHFDGYWRTVYGDGVYEPQEVLCGNATTPPDVNDIPNKIFRGWKARGEYADDAYTDVTDDMIFDAILEDVQTFTVTFKDWDGTVLSTEEVAIGESASAPAIIEGREGFDFVGWDKDFSKVTEAMTVTAQYEARTQGIEEPTSQESKVKSQKKLRDGILLIERNGKTYNAQGAEVK